MTAERKPFHQLIDEALLEAFETVEQDLAEGDRRKVHWVAFMMGGRLHQRRPDLWRRYIEAHDDEGAVSAMIDLMIRQLLELARLSEEPAPGLEGQAPPIGCEHPRVDRDGEKYICEDCGATLE